MVYFALHLLYMNSLVKIILCTSALSALALTGCKKCKNCAEYMYKDDSKGRPEYEKVSAEFCNDDLDRKEGATVPNSDTTAYVAQFLCE